ncbi:MAG: EI24 domain-containing protein [Flavobacteriales bacterium]|jgi:CysZ protein
MKDIKLNIDALLEMISYLKQGKFLKFFLPGIVITLIFWQVFIAAEFVSDSFAFLQSIPLIGDLLYSIISGTAGIFHFLLQQVFVFFILTVLSPFNTVLSENVDTEISKTPYRFDMSRIPGDIMRMIAIVSIALFFELIFTGLWWLISIMIGIHFLNEGIFFMIAAFFYGFSFYDYSLERHREGIGGSMNYALSNKLNLLLSGTIFLVLYNIPLIGVIIAPVLTTILSTIVYLKNKSQSTTNS